jgi:hypothetical protein
MEPTEEELQEGDDTVDPGGQSLEDEEEEEEELDLDGEPIVCPTVMEATTLAEQQYPMPVVHAPGDVRPGGAGILSDGGSTGSLGPTPPASVRSVSDTAVPTDSRDGESGRDLDEQTARSSVISEDDSDEGCAACDLEDDNSDMSPIPHSQHAPHCTRRRRAEPANSDDPDADGDSLWPHGLTPPDSENDPDGDSESEEEENGAEAADEEEEVREDAGSIAKLTAALNRHLGHVNPTGEDSGAHPTPRGETEEATTL